MKNRGSSSSTTPVDAHIHSHFSDGSRSPKKLVGLLKKTGVKLAILTDHDTVAGTNEFLYYADKAGITTFPGIEITASYGWCEVHILGYNIKYQLSSIETILRSNIEARRKRLNDTLQILSERRIIKTTENEIANWHKYKGPVVSMLHAIDFISHALKQDFQEVKKLFKRGGVAWTPLDINSILTATEAVKLITEELGGIAVLAHPGKVLKAATYKEDQPGQNAWFFLTALLNDLQQSGLRGIEAYHPKHSLIQQIDLAGLGAQIKLHCTAGSDFHGGKFKKTKTLGMYGMNVTDFLEIIR
ncbi:MAG: PHP domain-containing protein [bacterium]